MLILQRPLDAEHRAGWYATAHLGRVVTEAAHAHYRLERVAHLGSQGLYLYVPRE